MIVPEYVPEPDKSKRIVDIHTVSGRPARQLCHIMTAPEHQILQPAGKRVPPDGAAHAQSVQALFKGPPCFVTAKVKNFPRRRPFVQSTLEIFCV
jgi:hypothetical protein